MQVSIIIVNYNTRNLLENCINSIKTYTIELNYEIIVVDNASSDGSEEMVKKNFPEIKFVQSGANIGFGRANNLGISLAEGNNLFFLNSDTLLINNAVKILSDFVDKNTNIGVCGGNLFDINLKPANSFNRIMPGIWLELDGILSSFPSKLIFGKNRSFNFTENVIDVAYIIGADMMINKKVLSNIGLFDDNFFLYFEETELTNRIKKAGYKICNVPFAKIIHLEGASLDNNYAKIEFYNSSRKLYYSKIYNKVFARMALNLFRIKCYLGIFKSKLSGNYLKVENWRIQLKTI